MVELCPGVENFNTLNSYCKINIDMDVLREDGITVRCKILHQRTASLSHSQVTSRGRCYARA
jgi:hypothetical protein